MGICPLTPLETPWQTLPWRLMFRSPCCRRRRTAVRRDCSEFPHSFYSIFILSLSVICRSLASISPSISAHLCLPLFCWRAYNLVRDGDLIGNLSLVLLIASEYETISFKLSVAADGPNDRRDSSSGDRTQNTRHLTDVSVGVCVFLWSRSISYRVSPPYEHLMTTTGICGIFHSSCKVMADVPLEERRLSLQRNWRWSIFSFLSCFNSASFLGETKIKVQQSSEKIFALQLVRPPNWTVPVVAFTKTEI